MKKIALLVAAAVATISTSAIASFRIVDARSNGMGNTGVVSANYLLAPFHNPALGALFREKDDVGILIPGFGIKAYDEDESLQKIDDIQELNDRIDQSTTPAISDVESLDNLLNQLEGNKPLNVAAGLSFAIALPSSLFSTNLFAAGFADIIAEVGIASDPDPIDRYDNSEYALVAFAVGEVGISFAKEFDYKNQQLALGITPKYQALRTYSQRGVIDDFDIDDYDQSEINKRAFNLDFGAAWYLNNIRTGIVLKNLFSQEINTQIGNFHYKLEPQVTLGLGYMSQFYTLNFELDLTTQQRYVELDDDTRFMRLGAELNAWNWAQLRIGFEKDLEKTYDDAFSAGIGFSPFDLVSLDVAGSYAGENQFGASVNLSITF